MPVPSRADAGNGRSRGGRVGVQPVFDPCGEYAVSPSGGDRVVAATARHQRAFAIAMPTHLWGKSLHPRTHDKHLSEPLRNSVQHIMLNRQYRTEVDVEIAFTGGDRGVTAGDSSRARPTPGFPSDELSSTTHP